MTKSQKNELKKIIAAALFFALSYLPLGKIFNIVFLLAAYIIVGFEVLVSAIKNIKNKQIFDENFLMAIASIGAICIGEFTEGAAVMLFYQIGEFFQDYAVNKSRKSISSLMDIRPDYANIIENDEIKKVDPKTVKEGDIIVVMPGEKIPLDGVITEGAADLNTSALTGESALKPVFEGDDVMSGCISTNGALKIKVTRLFSESTVSKILELVENSSLSKTRTENFITKFAKYYTPAVVISALLLAIIPPIFVGDIASWIHRALIFLVISCPCALVISVPLSFFGGIGNLSKNGVLVKGSNFVEVLAKVDTIAFDKTGTLTKGNFKADVIYSPETENEQLLKYIAHVEAYSNHPVAHAIKDAYGTELELDKVSDYKEIAGYGVSAVVNGVIAYAGNEKLMEKLNVDFEKPETNGTVVYAVINNAYAGYITIEDEIKENAKAALEKIKACGAKNIAMLTGDSKEVGEKVASNLGIKTVYSSLLPEDKVECVRKIKADAKSKLAFVGDGINDAPVLALSDVGIAMGGIGSDAAIDAADVVVMDDNIEKIAFAIKISRKTLKIVKQNIIFALGIKALFLILGAFEIANMWEAVFADVGVMIIAILNAMRALK